MQLQSHEIKEQVQDESQPNDSTSLRNSKAFLRAGILMMIRSGMIGHTAGVTINTEYSGHFFHIDNVLHSGASGGPVVDSDGDLIGILTKRAITRVASEDNPRLRVPSGAAVAITPRILLPKLRELGVSVENE